MTLYHWQTFEIVSYEDREDKYECNFFRYPINYGDTPVTRSFIKTYCEWYREDEVCIYQAPLACGTMLILKKSIASLTSEFSFF